jgi:hypothetical protein
MAFNWFISVIQLQFDLIQTSDVWDLPPTKDTVRLYKQQQTADLREGGGARGDGWRRRKGRRKK